MDVASAATMSTAVRGSSSIDDERKEKSDSETRKWKRERRKEVMIPFDRILSLLYRFPLRAVNGKRKMMRVILFRDARGSARARSLELGD